MPQVKITRRYSDGETEEVFLQVGEPIEVKTEEVAVKNVKSVSKKEKRSKTTK